MQKFSIAKRYFLVFLQLDTFGKFITIIYTKEKLEK